MKDASTREVLWEQTEWGDVLKGAELSIKIPKRILQCPAVCREMTFSSAELVNNFRIQQNVYLKDTLIEEWKFAFGFVIPGSTNTWENEIEADGAVLPAEVLSGNLTIETLFYDGDFLVSKTQIRVHYV